MLARCPSCGAPPTLKSEVGRQCEYCGALLKEVCDAECRKPAFDTIALFMDTAVTGKLLANGVETMINGRRATWPYYARFENL